jgi:kynurenine formamidase
MPHYIDISVSFRDGIDGNIHSHLPENLPLYCGHRCTAFDVFIKSHHGTYYETSSHVFREGKNTSDTSMQDFFLPASIIKLVGNGGITGEELNAAGSNVRPGDALLIHSLNKDRYFEINAVQWMISRQIKLLGSDLPHYDTGFTHPTGIFIELFKAEIPIIANLEHLETVPVSRAQLIVLPLKINGIGTVPCRAVVLVDSDANDELPL